MESRRQVACDPFDAPGVGTVAFDGYFKDDVGYDAQRLEQPFAHARRREVVEDHEALVVVAET